MRIEAHANTSGQEMINTGVITHKLNVGDVLRAMVLEITSDEALLRLSGGGVLKAKTLETLNLKAGQFVELVVISKEEGTLFLETAKARHVPQHDDAETLSDLLTSLHIKPDNINIKLAAEFIKTGIPVTQDKISEALRLIRDFTGLDSEKAAFLLSPEAKDGEAVQDLAARLAASETRFELLVKLLDGELKLGQLLGELQELINNAGGAESGNDNKVGDGGMYTAASGDDGKGFALNYGKAAAEISAKEADINVPKEAGVNAARETWDSTDKNTSGGAGRQSVENFGKAVGKVSGTDGYDTERITDEIPGGITEAGTGYKAGDIRGNTDLDNTGKAPADNTVNAALDNTGIAYERQGRLAEYMERLFLKIRGDNLEADNAILSKNSSLTEKSHTGAVQGTFTAEKGILSAKEDLTETLGTIKSSIRQAGQYTPVSADNISEVITAISSTVKLLNEINYIGVPYFQLPVNINGYKTTAELFIMKRHKGGKRIDPNNLVMFISLDTKNIGRVETILNVKGENIYIRLRTEKRQISDYFRENIKRLYESFAECGYKLADVKYTVIENAMPPARLKRFLSGIAENGREHGRVDLRV